jgi:hypothetical protein
MIPDRAPPRRAVAGWLSAPEEDGVLLVMIGGEELAQVAGWGQIVPHEGRFPVSSLSVAKIWF